MFRLAIEEEEWIVRFSPHLGMDQEEREEIVAPLLQFGKMLSTFKHGDSFIIMNESFGMIVCIVEKIPSFILIISSVVPKNHWFVQEDHTIQKIINGKII